MYLLGSTFHSIVLRLTHFFRNSIDLIRRCACPLVLSLALGIHISLRSNAKLRIKGFSSAVCGFHFTLVLTCRFSMHFIGVWISRCTFYTFGWEDNFCCNTFLNTLKKLS